MNKPTDSKPTIQEARKSWNQIRLDELREWYDRSCDRAAKAEAQRDAAVAALRHFTNYCEAREIPATTNCTEELAHIHAAARAAIAAAESEGQ